MNWLAELANYDFEIRYRSGKHNVNADILSRKPEVEVALTEQVIDILDRLNVQE
jgi:hypothetical protein